MPGLNDDVMDLRGSSQAGSGLDGWGGQFDGFDAAEESAPKVSGQTIPTFPFYIVKFENGKGAVSKGKKATPMARLRAVVLNGPEGTVGERIFDDLYLRVSKTTTIEGVEVPKEDQDYQDDVEAFKSKIKKIARVGSFDIPFPTSPELPALDAYAGQFGNGFVGVIEVRESTETYQGVTRVKNRLIFESLRALSEPATKTGQKKGFKTAEEEALAAIATANQIAAQKASKDGRTAGSVARKGLAD